MTKTPKPMKGSVNFVQWLTVSDEPDPEPLDPARPVIPDRLKDRGPARDELGRRYAPMSAPVAATLAGLASVALLRGRAMASKDDAAIAPTSIAPQVCTSKPGLGT